MHWFDRDCIEWALIWRKQGLWRKNNVNTCIMKECEHFCTSRPLSCPKVVSKPESRVRTNSSQNQESVPTRHIYETKDMSGASVATLEYAVSCVRDGLNSRSNFPWRTDNVNIPCFEFVSSESLAKNYHRVLGKQLAMTRKLVIIISFLARWTIGRYGHYCPD